MFTTITYTFLVRGHVDYMQTDWLKYIDKYDVVTIIITLY